MYPLLFNIYYIKYLYNIINIIKQKFLFHKIIKKKKKKKKKKTVKI